MVLARAAAGFDGPHFGGHSLKRSALTTDILGNCHRARKLARYREFIGMAPVRTRAEISDSGWS